MPATPATPWSLPVMPSRRFTLFPAFAPSAVASNRPSSRLAGWIVWLLAACCLAAALGYLALRHYFWPRLDEWRPQIVAELGRQIGRPVEIARLQTGFEGLLPSLRIEGLTVADDDGTPALVVPAALLVLSPRTLLAAEPRLALLQLDSPRVRVERRMAGRWRVAGVDFATDAADEGSALTRLLEQRRIVVRGGRIDFHDRLADRRQTIESVDIGIGSVGRRHRGSISAGALPGGWQRLQFAVEFYRTPRSRPADPASWIGEVYAGADRADIGWLRRAGPALTAPLEALQADFKGWLRFDRGRLRDAQLKLAATDLRWRTGTGSAGLLSFPELALDARLRFEGEGSELTVDGLRLREGSGLTLTADGPLKARLDGAARLAGVQGALRNVDAGAALALMRRLPLEPAARRAIDQWAVSGRIASLNGRWTRRDAPRAAMAGPSAAPLAQPFAGGEFELVAGFEGLSARRLPAGPAKPAALAVADARPAIGLPWVENIDGQVRLSNAAGTLRIDARRAVIGFPGLLAEPVVPFDTLQGSARFAWEDIDGQRQFNAELETLRFANADAAGTVSGRYRTGGRGAGILDLQGRVERGEGIQIARYLPLSLSAPVREWVRRAVVAGRLDDLRFAVRGDLADFPFARPADGEFFVDARLADAVIDYAGGWPRIERGEGRFRLERNGLQVALRSGRLFDVALGPTTATIRDFGEAAVRIEGSGEGAGQQMIRFVNQSPLSSRIDDFVRDTVAQGNARLQLRLDLPLRELDRTRVAGSVTFLGNNVTLDSTIPPFSDVTGTLEFSDQGLALRGLSATFLGGPLKVDGETPEPGRFALRAQGRIDAANMLALVDNPLTRRLSGETGYSATIHVSRRAVSMTLDSDLVGLQSTLPAPFDKRAAARWPLTVRTSAEPPPDPGTRSMRDTIRVELGDAVRVALERERDPASARLLIRRGAFAIDGEPVLPERGLSLLLNTTALDLDAWLPLLMGGDMREAQQRAVSGFAPGFSLLPSSVSVVSPKVVVGGKQLHDVVFGATRVDGFWRANIGAREVNGFFNWREPAPGQRIGTLTARFARLEIPKARTSEFESLLDAAPDELPALDIAAEELVLGERRLGAMSLKATNSGTAALPVWRLDELKVANPWASLTATGTWAPARAGSPRATALDFELSVADAGQLLGVYGLRNALRGGVGTVSGNLSWLGSPMAIDYPSLGGRLRLEMGKGQFLKSEPGLAKLIGVLSLQSLPRRLSLDFRDVFAEGFSFDDIQGDVRVQAGVAHTERFRMRGVQAQVDIRGQASLAQETQALEVAVRPEINAGLASLAYAAIANPAIGLGTFLAQFVLRQPLQQLLSYEYRISGSWADPQVVEYRRAADAPVLTDGVLTPRPPPLPGPGSPAVPSVPRQP